MIGCALIAAGTGFVETDVMRARSIYEPAGQVDRLVRTCVKSLDGIYYRTSKGAVQHQITLERFVAYPKFKGSL